MSIKFEYMGVYGKTSLVGEIALQLIQIAGGEIYNLATAGANEMVMVSNRPPHKVAALVIFCMEGTDKVEFRQQLKSTVYGNASDAGMLLLHSLENLSRREVVVAAGDNLKHSPALGRDLVARPAQYSRYLSGC